MRAIIETEESAFSVLGPLARRLHIPYNRATGGEITKILESISEPTVVLSVNNNYIFPPWICHQENFRIVNFHNGPLPRYRGHGKVIPSWVVFNGERNHGVTWHLVSEDLDAGNVLAEAAFDVSPEDTALSIMTKCMRLGLELFSSEYPKLLDSSFRGHPQGKAFQRYYGAAELPNGGYMDTAWDFSTMSRFLRSMDSGPLRFLPAPRIWLGQDDLEIASYRIMRGANSEQTNVSTHQASCRGGRVIPFVHPEGTISICVTDAVSC